MPNIRLNPLVLALFGLLLSYLPATPLRAAAAPTQPPAAQPIDRILIVINDEIVTASEVEMRLQAVRVRLTAQKWRGNWA